MGEGEDDISFFIFHWNEREDFESMAYKKILCILLSLEFMSFPTDLCEIDHHRSGSSDSCRDLP